MLPHHGADFNNQACPSPTSSSKSSSGSNGYCSPPVFGGIVKGDRCVGCASTSSIRVHYGAPSCHGCKAFFRRSVYETRQYQCSNEGNCDVANESRNRCRACRFRKCLEGGMNPRHVREERQKDRGENHNSVSESEMNGRTSQPPPPTPKPLSAQDNQLMVFVCGVERSTEMLKDDDVLLNDDVVVQWSRDVSLAFGLLNPNMVIKRSPMVWTCQRAMNSADLYSQWYRAFVLHADWANSIPEFRAVPLTDQTLLFKQNFMAFSWITYSFKCYQMGLQDKGMPLGNGAYIPYQDDEQKCMESRWAVSYGTVCKKLIDLIVKPMIEMQMTFEEYVLLKSISLFQTDCPVQECTRSACQRMLDRLFEALAVHIDNRFPNLSQPQRTQRALRCSLLLPSFNHIGQIEASMIHNLSSVDLCELSGVPMDILNQHRPGSRPI